MKTRMLMVALVAGIAAAAAAQQPAYKRTVPPQLLRRAKVSEDSALKIAKARIPSGTVQSVELENEAGKLQWSFDFKVPNLPGTYEMNVDAATGAQIGHVTHELPDTTHPAAPKPKP